MARVNHKLVKKLLNEKRSKITDRQFFTSRVLAGHFEDMAAAQTRRYKYGRQVRVQLSWEPKSGSVACTDNMTIHINTGHPMVTKTKGRENRYQIVCGMFAHELGHVLYTDFLQPQTQANYMERGMWYPEPPTLHTSEDFANEKAMWAYLKADPKNLEAVKEVSRYISNVLEDGYIENRMLNDFPGTLGFGLSVLREKKWEEMGTVTDLKQYEDDGSCHIFQSILEVMLSYVKYGEIKYGDENLDDIRIQTIFDLITQLDRSITDPDPKTRLRTVNLILVRCWEHIQDYCEKLKAAKEAAESMSDAVKKSLGGMPGATTVGTGGTPVPGVGSSGGASATAANRAKTHEDAEAGNDESDDSKDEPTEEDPAQSDEDLPPLEGEGTKTGKQDVTDSEGGRIPYHQTSSLSEPVGGTTEYNADYEREQYDKAASDIDRMLDKMVERAACKQLENERLTELNEMANSISYGDIHSGVNIRINRIASVDTDLMEKYDTVAPRLVTISKQLQRSIQKELKEHRQGGKQTGLVMGRRLDTHALCRNDGKVFYKNNLPNEIPELAVGLLVDESGSMCSGDRCTYARAAAIILHDFCDSLDIPIMVYGHSTGWNTVELYSYAEFDGFDSDDRYRLMNIGARGSNRDGAALRFVAERLSKRPEAVKILILVSDGQPADTGYDGTAAEEDLRGIKQEYQRKGVVFVAAAIGDDKPNIQRIYGDSFLDITDLEQLPGKLTAVVKKHIKI